MTFIFLFAMSLTANTSHAKKMNLKIQSKYQLNKNIWGTYKQVWEITSLRKKRPLKMVHRPLGSIIFKNQKLHFMKSSVFAGRTKLNIESFKYKKKRKQKNIVYLLDSKEHHDELYDIYIDRIQLMFRNYPEYYGKLKNIEKEKIEFKNFNCKRQKKSIMYCSIEVQIKIKNDTDSSKLSANLK